MNYKTLSEKNAAFFNARPNAKRVLLVLNIALTAVFFLAYTALVLWSWIAKFDVWACVKILGIPALCLVLVMMLRLMIDRPRPYSAAGANIEPLLRKKSKDKESFPSRHLACAFVIAAVFAPYLLWASFLLAGLGLVLGYIRFALGLHYPTDLLGGAALGLLCGLLLLI